MATTPDQVLKWAFSLNPFSLGSSCLSKKTFWLIQDSAKDNSRSFHVCAFAGNGNKEHGGSPQAVHGCPAAEPVVSLASSPLTLSSRPPWT